MLTKLTIQDEEYGYQSIYRVTIFVEMAYSFFILKLSKDASPENTFKPVKYSHYIITANE
jgi:hypothetical protein